MNKELVPDLSHLKKYIKNDNTSKKSLNFLKKNKSVPTNISDLNISKNSAEFLDNNIFSNVKDKQKFQNSKDSTNPTYDHISVNSSKILSARKIKGSNLPVLSQLVKKIENCNKKKKSIISFTNRKKKSSRLAKLTKNKNINSFRVKTDS